MVANAEQAAASYREGVTRFGVENYGLCGDKASSGFLAVAGCLHAAKKRALTVENMVAKYKAKAGSG